MKYCKLCGRESDDVFCGRCAKIREDVITDLTREFSHQREGVYAIGVEGDRG